MLVLPAVVAAAVIWKSSGTPDGKCPKVDALDETVLLANLDDCSSFYSCSDGVAILMHCPDGLHFNAELRTCDWPQTAQCGADLNILKGYFLDCVDGGVETGVFNNSGKASIMGQGVEGSVGSVYQVKWERWSCIVATGNPDSTCDKREQGVRAERL